MNKRKAFYFILLCLHSMFIHSQDPIFSKQTGALIAQDGQDNYYAAWSDYNNDGLIDLAITGEDNTSSFLLYRGNTNENFTLGQSTNSIVGFGASWGDYDNDGDDDLLVANLNGEDVIFVNDGLGNFTILKESKFRVDYLNYQRTWSIQWIDVNNDGYLDIIQKSVFGAIKLLFGSSDFLFTEATTGYFATASASSRTVLWSDYNNDGLQDFFIPGTSQLYRNTGDDFIEVSTELGISKPDTITSISSASWVDFNNDGLMDLFHSQYFSQNHIPSLNILYLQQADGTFSPISDTILDNLTIFCHASAWGDFDNDGYLDLFLTNGDWYSPNVLLKNNEGISFSVVDELNKDVACSYGCSWMDYNNDGFLDLFVTNTDIKLNQNDYLYKNELANGNSNNYIKVKCIGTRSNNSSIGAKVFVRAIINGKELEQKHEISGQSGQYTQAPLIQHFGIGDAATIKYVKVIWPSGEELSINNPAVNSLLTCIEPITKPFFQVSPSFIDFEIVELNSDPIKKSIEILNKAPFDFKIDRITFKNGNHFTIVSNYNTIIPSGQTETIEFEFDPNVEGDFKDTLVIYHDGEEIPVIVPVCAIVEDAIIIPDGESLSGELGKEKKYIFLGKASVETGTKLIVRSGAQLYFRTGTKSEISNSDYDVGCLIINGNALFQGSKEEPILCSRYGNRGHWGNIYIDNNNDSCEFNYCTFEYADAIAINGSKKVGAITIGATDSVKIIRCIFRNNNNYGVSGNLASWKICYSVFHNNIKGGINLSNSNKTTTINNCLLYNNGIAISTLNSTCYVSGNTLINNQSSYSGFMSTTTIDNSIIWNNTSSPFSVRGGLRIKNSCIPQMQAGGDITLEASNIMNINPLLVGDDDFSLTYHSPCINKGTLASASAAGEFDLAHNKRIVGDTIDMGAYEFFKKPYFQVTPSFIDYENVVLNCDFLKKKIEILNKAPFDFEIDQIALKYANHFTIVSNYDTIIPSGKSKIIELEFNPNVVGEINDTLFIFHDGENTPIKIPIHALVEPAPTPDFQVSPLFIDYDTIQLNSEITNQSIKITNNASINFEIDQITFEYGNLFDIVSNYDTIIPSGQSELIGLEFNPSVAGEINDSLFIYHDGEDAPIKIPIHAFVKNTIPTGMYKNITASDEIVTIYPIPTKDILNIEMAGFEQMQLFDITGNLLFTTRAKSINTSIYPNGIYIIKVFHINENNIIRTVIISH